jgi:hypothetical protein
MNVENSPGTGAVLPLLPHCGKGFEEIAGCAWLMLKYIEARQLAFKTAGRFISKEEFLAAPQYSIAVTPLTLVFLMQNRMSYANLILSGPPAQNASPIGSARGASPRGSARGGAQPVLPNRKKQVRELRIANPETLNPSS